MQFRVHCSLDNPLKGFTSDSAPNASLSHQSGQTASKPHVSVTCLPTGAPPPGVHKRSQSLRRGLNFVTVCVTLSAALMGYQVVRQPLWIRLFEHLGVMYKLHFLHNFEISLRNQTY